MVTLHKVRCLISLEPPVNFSLSLANYFEKLLWKFYLRLSRHIINIRDLQVVNHLSKSVVEEGCFRQAFAALPGTIIGISYRYRPVDKLYSNSLFKLTMVKHHSTSTVLKPLQFPIKMSGPLCFRLI